MQTLSALYVNLDGVPANLGGYTLATKGHSLGA